MAQEPRLERGRSRGGDWQENDRFDRDDQDRGGEFRPRSYGGYGRSAQGYSRDYGDEGSSGYGGDFGRWQQGERYGRGQETSGGNRGSYGGGSRENYSDSDRNYQNQSGFNQGGSSEGGPNFGSQNYGSGSYGRNTSREGAYPQSYNEMYGNAGQAGQYQGGQYQGGAGQYGGLYGGQYGSHAGKGPKNYTRSDDRIREDVSDRLTDDAHLDASEIDVQVRDGEVMLSGTVSDRQAKRRAEDCIESCSGVKHVQNNLRVKDQFGSSQRGETSDQESRTAAGLNASPGSSSSSSQGSASKQKSA